MKPPKELAADFLERIESISKEPRELAIIIINERLSEAGRWQNSYMGRERLEYLKEVKKELETL